MQLMVLPKPRDCKGHCGVEKGPLLFAFCVSSISPAQRVTKMPIRQGSIARGRYPICLYSLPSLATLTLEAERSSTYYSQDVKQMMCWAFP
jgi:hypothetical protein